MKKIRLKRKIKKFFSILSFFFCMIFFFICFFNIKLYSSNEEFILSMLRDSNYYMKYEKNNVISNFVDKIYSINLQKPITLLESSLNYTNDMEDEYNPEELLETSKHIYDPNPSNIEEAIVYIYNTHQLENYDNSNYEAYNITPNVMMASYMLKEKLNNMGIGTIVEEGNITEFIRINNWSYDYSYLASRYFINDAIKKNESLKYFIDLHRDSVKRSYSTTTIGDKSYAKVLFVVGLEHKDYQYNLDLANLINNKIKNKYPSLTRGVLTKQGKNVNGIYNQDISKNSILIEVGGYENKIEEVLNTIEIISEILKEVIDERG